MRSGRRFEAEEKMREREGACEFCIAPRTPKGTFFILERERESHFFTLPFSSCCRTRRERIGGSRGREAAKRIGSLHTPLVASSPFLSKAKKKRQFVYFIISGFFPIASPPSHFITNTQKRKELKTNYYLQKQERKQSTFQKTHLQKKEEKLSFFFVPDSFSPSL